MVANDAELFISAFDGSTGRSYVWAVPKAGGSPRVVHEDTDGISALALDAGDLLYAAGTRVNRLATTSGQPIPISSAKAGARSLTALGDRLYWVADAVTSPWDGGIFVAPLNGGPSTALASGIRGTGLHVTGGSLYAIGSGTPADAIGKLVRIPLAGGNLERIGAGNFAGAKGMVGVGAEIFMLAERVYRVALDSGDLTPLYDDDLDESTHSIAAAGDRVYWTRGGIWPGSPNIGSGRVRRVDPKVGTVVDLAVCLPKPGPLVVDQQHVYWLNWLSGEVLRAPR